MKILVPVKRVVDYNVKIRVKPDGSGVDLANVKMSMNPFDEIAVEEATPAQGSRQGNRSRRRVDRCRPNPRKPCAPRSPWAPTGRSWSRPRALWSRLAVAKILKGMAGEESPDLMILGKQAIDDDANQTGQMLRRFSAGARQPSPPRLRSATARPTSRARSMAACRRSRSSCRRSSPPTCASTSRATPRCPTS
jgi:hypothetical protein